MLFVCVVDIGVYVFFCCIDLEFELMVGVEVLVEIDGC